MPLLHGQNNNTEIIDTFIDEDYLQDFDRPDLNIVCIPEIKGRIKY
jgi:hypothetical protein